MQVSEHLEAERRTVKALRAELQSLSTSTESHVTRLATELEAKQGLLRGLQTTVQSVKADAESSRSQAEAASSALASLRDAGSDLDRVCAQLNRERQVRMVHNERDSNILGNKVCIVCWWQYAKLLAGRVRQVN